MGIVYLARERRSGLSVAIKLLDARVAERGEASRFFAREARIVAGLDHPRIVRTLAVEELDGRPVAIVSEFVHGWTLRRYLRGRGPLPFDRVTAILRDVAAGLAYAHRVRVVHRDVKPENIYIAEESGRASLGDFGIARAPGRVAGSVSARTVPASPNITFGTPTYMSPEQARGEEVDERADVYSLALVGWEMLSGVRPWEGEAVADVLRHQQLEPLPSLATMRPDIPAFLLIALEGAMEKEPSERWSDGGELLLRLTPKPVTLRGRGDESDAPTEALTIPVAPMPNVRSEAAEAAADQVASSPHAEEVADHPPTMASLWSPPNAAEPRGDAREEDARSSAEEVALCGALARYEAPSLVLLDAVGAPIAHAEEFDPPGENPGEERSRPRRHRRWITAAATALAVVTAVATLVTPRGLGSLRAERSGSADSASARAAAGEVALGDSPPMQVAAVYTDVETPTPPSDAGGPVVDSTVRRDSVTPPASKARNSGTASKSLGPKHRAATVKARVRPSRTIRRSVPAKAKRKSIPAPTPKKSVSAMPVRDERCRSPRESDQEACLKVHTARADAAMNDAYQRLTSALSRTTTGAASRSITVAALRSEQAGWERTRLTTCQRRASATNNALWGLERAPCYASMARQRELALRARLAKAGQNR